MIDLAPFCNKEKTRYALADPWLLPTGKVAASDNRIAVVVDRDLVTGKVIDPKTTDGRFPDVLTVVDPGLNITIWHLPPDFGGCNKCKSTGRIERKCLTCGGPIYSNCRCTVEIGGRRFFRYLANKIVALPNMKWGLLDTGSESPIYFRFTGGCGAMMPVGKNAERANPKGY